MDLGEIVGLVGGSIGIAKTAWDGYQAWKNRGKVDINLLRLSYFLDQFPPGTGPITFSGPPGHQSGTELLDCTPKNSFTILEIEVENRHRRPVTIARIQIDDWIYSESYHRHMYDRYKDYRVFDLYTREPTSLASPRLLLPDQIIGLRIEIIEQSDGPFWESNHRYVGIPNRSEYVVRLEHSKGVVTEHIPIPEPTEVFGAHSGQAEPQPNSPNLRNFAAIARWSGQDLIPGGEPGIAGEPKP